MLKTYFAALAVFVVLGAGQGTGTQPDDEAGLVAGLVAESEPGARAGLGVPLSSLRRTSPEKSALTSAELHAALRSLWTGHVFWVRSVVVASHYEDDAAAEAAEAKAVENARSLANAITPFYGQEAADALFGLLAGHYGSIKEYMQAQFDGDPAGAKAATAKLVANAEAIADFLDGANPNLPKEVVLPLLVGHGGHHMQQINQIKAGDFTSEAKTWDDMLGHIYAISDAMAGALAKQFPDKVQG